MVVVVVVLGFYVSPTAKVIRRRDLGLKSHPKDSTSWYKMCMHIGTDQLAASKSRSM